MTDEGINYGYLTAFDTWPTKDQLAYWRGRPATEFLMALYKNNEAVRWRSNQYPGIVAQLTALQNKPPEVVVKEVEKIVESCKLPADLTPAESSKFRGILLWLADKLVK